LEKTLPVTVESRVQGTGYRVQPICRSASNRSAGNQETEYYTLP
jgi:hypothetical protein